MTNWRAPEKADELRAALKWLLDERPSFVVQAERGVIANYYRQTHTGRVYVHLVNLCEQPVANVEIRVALAQGQAVSDVQILSPDKSGGTKPEWKIKSGILHVIVPVLDVYAIGVIQ